MGVKFCSRHRPNPVAEQRQPLPNPLNLSDMIVF